MKKLILIIFTFTISTFLLGQNNGLKNAFYLPNGEKYIGIAHTMGEINLEMEEYGRVYIYTYRKNDFSTDVGFKLFTDEPLWILTTDTNLIENAIKSFNLYEYLNSWEFEFDLERYIKMKTLTDIFILETIGKPDKTVKRVDSDSSLENWYYYDLGITLTLTNGIVTSYISIN